MKEIIAKLADFKDLSSAEMTDVIERIVTGQVEESQIAAFLLGLKMKGRRLRNERLWLRSCEAMLSRSRPLFALLWTIAVRAGTSLSVSMFRLLQLLY